jgi:hypothetical protein
MQQSQRDLIPCSRNMLSRSLEIALSAGDICSGETCVRHTLMNRAPSTFFLLAPSGPVFLAPCQNDCQFSGPGICTGRCVANGSTVKWRLAVPAGCSRCSAQQRGLAFDCGGKVRRTTRPTLSGASRLCTRISILYLCSDGRSPVALIDARRLLRGSSFIAELSPTLAWCKACR